MSTATSTRPGEAPADTDATVIITSDSHVGPRMVEDLRPYCPKQHLEQFDEFVGQVQGVRDWWLLSGAPGVDREGHYDSEARAADLAHDGVVGEVLFHFSFNGELIPFVPTFAHANNPTDLGQAAIGLHIYNRWLADFCNDLPGQRVGLAQLPLWDLDRSVAEVEWAAEAGLRGVNFPAMRDNLTPYDDPVYEPLWAACAAHGMPLTTHAGSSSPSSLNRQVFLLLESGGVLCRRGVHRMILSGVFDRHPNLKLVMTEQPGLWQRSLMIEMDSAYKACVGKNGSSNKGAAVRNIEKGITISDPKRWEGFAINAIPQDVMPKLPSEYFLENVFVGASFMAHFEAVDAVENGYSRMMMWGSDYPHPEGTFKPPADADEPSQTVRALQMTFEGLPAAEIRAMTGGNAARCYGLDLAHLQQVAEEIGAPSPQQLATAPEGPLVGEGGTGGYAFRTEAHWT